MLQGVIFDLDGTLIHQEIDFAALRAEIGLPDNTPLLEAMAQMAEDERRLAEAILHRHEFAAAARAEALPGVADLLRRLDEANIRRAVLTRNSGHCAEIALLAAGLNGFDLVLTRDNAPFKPSPGGILQACRHWSVSPSEVAMVGDYIFDVQAGRAAGAKTALVTHGRDWHFAAEADFVFDGFDPFPVEFWQWLCQGDA